MAKRVYYQDTEHLRNELIRLFDFIGPLTVAAWTLRRDAAQFMDWTTKSSPAAMRAALQARFIHGSGVHGANLQSFVTDHPWSYHEEELAKMVLFMIFSLFEGWTEHICTRLGFPRHYEALQQPNKYAAALRSILAAKSPNSVACFFPALDSSDSNRIHNLLLVYRCFKAKRNKIAHAGGIADSETKREYDAFAKLTPGDIGAKEVPRTEPVVVGTPVRLSLRGVRGFSDIVRRLAVALDRELSQQVYAETELKSRWLDKYGELKLMKSERNGRETQLREWIWSLNFPRPVSALTLVPFLQDHRLVRI